MKSVSYRHKWLICSLACFFTAFLIAVSANTCKQEADASRIAPYVLRFHILAESNSKTDQELKLKSGTRFFPISVKCPGSCQKRRAGFLASFS